MTDGRYQRNAALGGGAHDVLVVEAPQVFEAATAARDDQHVGAWNFAARFEGVEAADGRCDLSGTALALHTHWPEKHMRRIALGEASQHVADDGTRR